MKAGEQARQGIKEANGKRMESGKMAFDAVASGGLVSHRNQAASVANTASVVCSWRKAAENGTRRIN